MQLTRHLLTVLALLLPSLAQTNEPTALSVIRNITKTVDAAVPAESVAKIRYVTADWNWLQSPADDLTAPGNVKIQLTPCPQGIDTAANHHYPYKVRIAGTGSAEIALVTGGTCTSAASSGTIVLNTVHAHSAGYTVGSASSGIQEAWNDQWVSDANGSPSYVTEVSPNVKLVPGMQYSIYAAVYLRGIGGTLDGTGALINCYTRDRCIFIGTTQNASYIHYHQLQNLTMSSAITVDGTQVSSISDSSGTYTVTTVANAHNFVVGDTVDCEYSSQNSGYAHQVVTVMTTTSNTFTFRLGSSTFGSSTYTFGFCNILNAAVEDNSDHVKVDHLSVIQSFPTYGPGKFSYGIVNNNDQQLQITHMENRSYGVIENTANFPNGAMIYQRADQGNAGITYIHNAEFTNVNCVTAAGNGLVIEDSVCQAYPVYGVRYAGGIQPVTTQNLYQETGGPGMSNPLYGYAASMGYLLGGGGFGDKIVGAWPSAGYTPIFPCPKGEGSITRNYFVQPHFSLAGYGPMLYAGTSSGSRCASNGDITVQWPSVQSIHGNNVSYDVYLTTGNAIPPNGTGMLLASGTSTCNTGGICSYVDPSGAGSSHPVPAQGQTVNFWFWPVTYAINSGVLLLADEMADGVTIASGNGINYPSIIASQCRSAGQLSQISPAWIDCLTSDAGSPAGAGLIANVLYQGSPAANRKGILNFGKPISTPNDIITLADSNSRLTTATAGMRPQNAAADMAIGVDQDGGIAFRAPTSISNYIDAQPSGPNYQERLTSSLKSFTVPIQTTPVDFRMLPKCVAATEGYMRSVKDSTTRTWGDTIAGGASNHVLAYCDGSNWTVAAK
jgi:hypothetical protein